MCFDGGSAGEESDLQGRRFRLDPYVGKSPWRRKWQPTPVFLPGKCHRERSLTGYSSCSHKRVRQDLVTKTTVKMHLHAAHIFKTILCGSDNIKYNQTFKGLPL